MRIIKHRCNTVSALKQCPKKYGVEVDVRSILQQVVLGHDALLRRSDYTAIDEWFDFYDHNSLILNCKEDGLETQLIKMLEERGVCDYFFLDLPAPTMVNLVTRGFSKVAVRVSEWEPVECVLPFKNKADWLWIDCFTRFPIGVDDCKFLKDLGFKICIVSPELQGHDKSAAVALRDLLFTNDFLVDAVCTKFPDAWD